VFGRLSRVTKKVVGVFVFVRRFNQHDDAAAFL
jgi:hypothetical protein